MSDWPDSASLASFAAGAAVLAVGDGLWVVEVAHGAGGPGLFSTVAWPVGVLLLALAPYQKLRAVPGSSSRWAKIGVPGAAAVACLPIILLSASATPQHVLAVVALALVVVRLTVSLRDNARLFETIQEASVTDPLTGLANRRLLLDRLGRALARQSRRGGTTGVLFLDLDEFKAVNDAYGHEVGDEVLIAVGERLREALREEDTVARGNPGDAWLRGAVGRLGGDEFVVLLEGIKDPADAGGWQSASSRS